MLSQQRLAPEVQCVRNIKEPSRLVLAWQAPDQFNDRFRWAVGALTLNNGDYQFRYFDDVEFEKLNSGRAFRELKGLGYRGYPVFPPGPNIFKLNVLLPFLRRLPPRSRVDFGAYLKSFMIAPDAVISDFALLGLTEAKLPSDGFSLVDELLNLDGERELFIELAGHRHHLDKIEGVLVVGEPIELQAEPSNPHDSGAVVALYKSQCIGYINRLQAPSFLSWIAKGRVTATLQKLNGSQERPRAFIFVKVAA